MEFQTIRAAERPGGIGVITLNRPEQRNAISIRMRREISDCLGQWRDNEAVGTVIFIGAGQAFSAGFDLDEFRQPECFADLLASSSSFHRDIWYFPKPTIAAVNGPAIGGGFDLALLCDLRLCAESALFGHLEVKFGAPPLFTPLRWIVGDGLARDLCLTGRRVDAREAYRIGLVSEVVRDDVLWERALELAGAIPEAPRDTLAFLNACFTDNAGKGFEESFTIEHDRAFREVLFKKFRGGR